jgi:hypothetical protein
VGGVEVVAQAARLAASSVSSTLGKLGLFGGSGLGILHSFETGLLLLAGIFDRHDQRGLLSGFHLGDLAGLKLDADGEACQEDYGGDGELDVEGHFLILLTSHHPTPKTRSAGST